MGEPVVHARSFRASLIIALAHSAVILAGGVSCDAQPTESIPDDASETQAGKPAIAVEEHRSGRALYNSGEYAPAVDAFKDELRAGPPTSSLLYNLGNACFKAGHLGEAILYYERARRLAPRDVDIQDNLALAHLATVDRFLEPPRPWPLDLPARLHRQLRAHEAAAIVTGLFWFLCFAIAGRCAAVAPRWPRPATIATVVAALLLLPAMASLGVKLYESAYAHEAIVLVEEAELRSGPGESFSSTVMLHEGAKLRIAKRRGVWIYATTQAGVDGWVRSSHIEGI